MPIRKRRCWPISSTPIHSNTTRLMANKKHDKPSAEDTPETPERPESTPQPAPLELRTPMRLASALAVCAAGWLLPGVSHVVLGRWGRGLIFTSSVVTMFVFGIVMQGRLYDFTPQQPLHIFAFMANVGNGLPYILAQSMGYGVGVLSSPSYDYGNTFLWVSGLLNYLVVLDAFDISRGRKP